MNVTYQSGSEHNYMIPDGQIPADEGYILQMLEDNHIPGFLDVSLMRMNGEQKIRYDITSRQPLTVIYAHRSMTGADIRALLNTLLEGCACIRSFLLNPEDILFLPECIYLDPEEHQPLLCYLPGFRLSGEDSYEALSAFLLRHLDHSDKEAVELGYGFFEKAHQPNFSFVSGVKALLQETNDHILLQEAAACEPLQGGDEAVHDESKKRKPRLGNTSSKGCIMREPVDRQTDRTDTYPDFPDFFDEFAVEDKVLLEEEKPKQKRKEKKRKAFSVGKGLVFAILAAVIVYVGLIWFFDLDLTQIGGLAFLFIAVLWLAYGTIQEKKTRKTSYWETADRDIEEDEFMEQLMHEVYGKVSPETVRSDRSLREEAKSGERAEKKSTEDPHTSGWLGLGADSGRQYRDTEESRYGQTRILTLGADMPEVTLVSEQMAYPSLSPLLPESLLGKQADEVDLLLPRHSSISRIHAKLECSSQGIYLTDQNSTNGTFVNGARIHERTVLREGDRVSFAGISYRLRVKNKPG